MLGDLQPERVLTPYLHRPAISRQRVAGFHTLQLAASQDSFAARSVNYFHPALCPALSPHLSRLTNFAQAPDWLQVE